MALTSKLKTFQKNIDWFRANYGSDHFSPQKADLIWEELKDFSEKQIDSLFHKIIGESEFAPKVGTFRTWASCLREKIRQHERESERSDAKHFWEGTYHSSEVAAMVQTIKLRMQGKLPDDDWRQFKDLIKSGKQPACRFCEDTGVHYSDGKPFKCFHGKIPSPNAGSFVSRTEGR